MNIIDYHAIDAKKINSSIINVHNLLLSKGLQITQVPSIEVMLEPVSRSSTVHGAWKNGDVTGLTFKCLYNDHVNKITTLRTTHQIEFRLDHINTDDDPTSTSIVELNFVLNDLSINKQIKF